MPIAPSLAVRPSFDFVCALRHLVQGLWGVEILPGIRWFDVLRFEQFGPADRADFATFRPQVQVV